MAELRDKGIEIANEAVADDNAGRYEEAIQKYIKAAEWLLTATKYEKNPVTLKTLRDKCIEYTKRAEDLKKGLEATTKSRAGRPQSAGGGAGGDAAEDDSDEDEPEPEPLTEEQLKAAEQEMEEELGKLVGMESVKKDMRRLCKELSLDLRRRQQGHKTLEPIRHMMFTGNPGVGKTTISRLVAKLYRRLGVSAKDQVVEVQKGDLVAGFVNQTAAKTAKHIKAARGGILFVDEAYQLTEAISSGRADFGQEAINEMMKVMNDKGRKAVTFVFAGYKKEMDEFVVIANPGLESRIKYRFHFDDYTVDELVVIVNLKMKAMGYQMTADAASSLGAIIDKGTTAELRSKYNGRLTDNLLQWASNEMNERLPLDATGDQLITLSKSDLEKATLKFITAKPPVKKDPMLIGGKKVEEQLRSWSLQHYCEHFVRAGYRDISDLLELQERDVRALGVSQDADVRRMMQLVQGLRVNRSALEHQMDALYIDPDMVDVRTWLETRHLGEFLEAFEQHKIDFEVLGDITYDDLKEMGIVEVGPRRKVFRAITMWRDERDQKKAIAIRARMDTMEARQAAVYKASDDVTSRIRALKAQQSQDFFQYS